MKLSDLKSGNIVETREGKKYIVLLNSSYGDILINLEDGCYLELCNYTQDLKNNYGIEYEIIKVCANDYAGYDLRSHGLTKWTADYKWTWEKEKVRKMTVAEICKKLGYDIEIVKE